MDENMVDSVWKIWTKDGGLSHLCHLAICQHLITSVSRKSMLISIVMGARKSLVCYVSCEEHDPSCKLEHYR